jgi:sRNA-binding protein
VPRIDLDGNVAGEVAARDEHYAQRMIAGLARRAAAKAIEDRKAANQAAANPFEKRSEPQKPTCGAKQLAEQRVAQKRGAEI